MKSLTTQNRFKLNPPSWSTLFSLFVMALTILVSLLTQPAPQISLQAVPPGTYNETLEGRVIKILDEQQVQLGLAGEEQVPVLHWAGNKYLAKTPTWLIIDE